jgi:hypothetical protein
LSNVVANWRERRHLEGEVMCFLATFSEVVAGGVIDGARSVLASPNAANDISITTPQLMSAADIRHSDDTAAAAATQI